MKRIAAVVLLVTFAFSARAAATNDLNLNGLAAFEQLRKEYFIGALYLGWPGHDPATIINMPGKKRIEMRITADRWAPLRFAQQINQLILINNDGATLNANVMDVLAFTSIPKGDLVAGDQLAIELEPDAGTVVSLNGATVLRTSNATLFNMLLNVWIGSRPPTSEFKRDILTQPKDKAGTELLARYEATKPVDGRKRLAISWGGKVESEAPPAAAAPAIVEAPKPKRPPETVAVIKPEPEVKAKPEVKEKPEIKEVVRAAPPPAPTPIPAPTPQPVSKPVAVEAPKPAPVQPQAAPQPDNSSLAMAQKTKEVKESKEEKEKLQQELYNDYLMQVRRLVNRKIEYPRRAVKDAIEGLVVLRVKVDRGGNLQDIELAQSAHDWLDNAAQAAVNKAVPFPPANEKLEGSQFQFLVPIVFKLTN